MKAELAVFDAAAEVPADAAPQTNTNGKALSRNQRRRTQPPRAGASLPNWPTSSSAAPRTPSISFFRTTSAAPFPCSRTPWDVSSGSIKKVTTTRAATSACTRRLAPRAEGDAMCASELGRGRRAVFSLRIVGKPGPAGIRDLRALLKRLLRQYGFVCYLTSFALNTGGGGGGRHRQS